MRWMLDRDRLKRWLVGTMICITVHPAIASDTHRCGSLERIVSALNLSRLLYPTLKDRELRVTISDGYLAGPPGGTDGRAFRLLFEKATSASGEKNQQEEESGAQTSDKSDNEDSLDLNNIQFNFFSLPTLSNDRTCPPVSLQILSTNNQIQSAEKLAIEHPEWSDEELVSALKHRGMRFGPRDKTALMKNIPLEELKTYYGPLQIEQVRFSLLNDEQRKVVGTNFMELRWFVDLKELRSKRHLGIQLDAFTGRIRDLGETQDSGLGGNDSGGPQKPKD